MKRAIMFLTALMLSAASVPFADTITANADDGVSSLEILSSDNYSKEVDWTLWDRFLKYDLCITDYDSLTDEEKELCRFIFETERSAVDTVRCERARHILEGNTVNGGRMTLSGILDNQVYIDPINPEYGVIDLYIDNYVPDVSHLDYDVNVNEYWLDDSGSKRILCDSTMTLEYVCFEADDSDNALSQSTLSDGTAVYYKFLDLHKKTGEGIIEQDGNYYVITPDHTATLIRSITVEGKNIDDSLKEIIIPDEINGCPVTKINSEAFKDSAVTKIVLPETLTHIGDRAFYNCQNLEEINIPETLEYLGNAAFMQCYSLSDISINCPELFIGDYAFYCVGLSSAELNVKSVGYRSFWAFELDELTLGDNLMHIKSEAFYKCTALSNIQLPSSLKSIGQKAFSATALESVTIPSNVEIVGSLPAAYGSTMTDIMGEIAASDPLTESDSLISDDDCTICGYYSTEAHSYALGNDLKFNALDELEYGDTNLDGSINVADAVVLQNYLLRGESVGYEADLNKDGRIDVFDMIAMRHSLVISN